MFLSIPVYIFINVPGQIICFVVELLRPFYSDSDIYKFTPNLLHTIPVYLMNNVSLAFYLVHGGKQGKGDSVWDMYLTKLVQVYNDL